MCDIESHAACGQGQPDQLGSITWCHCQNALLLLLLKQPQLSLPPAFSPWLCLLSCIAADLEKSIVESQAKGDAAIVPAKEQEIVYIRALKARIYAEPDVVIDEVST